MAPDHVIEVGFLVVACTVPRASTLVAVIYVFSRMHGSPADIASTCVRRCTCRRTGGWCIPARAISCCCSELADEFVEDSGWNDAGDGRYAANGSSAPSSANIVTKNGIGSRIVHT